MKITTSSQLKMRPFRDLKAVVQSVAFPHQDRSRNKALIYLTDHNGQTLKGFLPFFNQKPQS